jgi:hypothetical protein
LLQAVPFFCGILASLVYVIADQLAGRLMTGYSFAARSMSDLSAAGSPTRTLVLWLNLAAGVLLVAFGTEVWRAGGHALLSRIKSALLIGNAALGLIGIIFFPMNYGERPEFASTGVIIMFLSVVYFVLAMLFGAAAYSGWFRIVSIGLPAGFVIMAVLRFATAALAPARQATSLIGMQERIMVYSFLCWVLAFAVYLLTTGRGVDLQ